MEEDAFGKGVTAKLNKMVLGGRIDKLIIIAAPAAWAKCATAITQNCKTP